MIEGKENTIMARQQNICMNFEFKVIVSRHIFVCIEEENYEPKPRRLAHWLRCRHCFMASFAGSSPTQGGKLVADARDQQPFEPREWGLRVR